MLCIIVGPGRILIRLVLHSPLGRPRCYITMTLDDQLLNVNTASAEASIWQGLEHDCFRADIVALQRASHEVPCDPKVYDRGQWHNSRIRLDDPSRLLSFEVEQRVADDLAFLAAAYEGVKAVSAVALEESVDPVGLVIRLAANGVVPQKIAETFRPIFDLLRRCAARSVSFSFSVGLKNNLFVST